VTLTVEDDFREFVAARWPDLEGVAYLVTLDPATARRVTTDALATLHQQWREALDGGRPGAMARRSVLAGAVAAAGPDAVPSPTPWPVTEDDDPVLTSLEAAVRAATPIERALVGAGSVWGAGPDEVADLLGMPVGDVRTHAATLRERLVEAHDVGRAAEGLAPADWALDVDLDATVEHLLTGQGDPPDPAALVEHRRRSLRRRSAVVGGAAVLAAGAAGWWLLSRETTAGTGGPSTAATPTGLPSPDDPSWERIAGWAARGRLAADPRVQGLVISRTTGGGRLLWADDVAGRRVVVACVLNPGTDDVILQAWQGPAGADPASLDDVPLNNPYLPGGQDVVAVAVSASPGTLLVVLARPALRLAQYSPTVQPTVEGTIRRSWAQLPMTAGIGTTGWPEEPGPALRVRCGGVDGPATGSAQTWVGQSGTDGFAGFAEETSRFVAKALGLPSDRVRTEVVTDVTVGGSVIDPTAISPQGGDGRVRVLRTTTADGAVIRSVRVVDDGRSKISWLDLEAPAVLPADTPRDEPVVLRLDDSRPRVGRFLVIAPGAARVQLISTSPNAYPVSKVTTTRRGGVAIVEVVNADDAAAFRLVRRDATGHRFGTAVPRASRDLLDLWPPDRSPGS
jgi:hypothetical protein